MLSNIEQDTDICVLVDTRVITGQMRERIAGYSGEAKLPVIVVSQIDFIIVSLYVLLRAYRLTVILILIVK